MTDERLIEEAAKAIIEVEYPDIAFGLLSEKRREFRRRQARAALAVFEKAHTPTTPTGDEREAQGWREAALYAEDAESQDDFMTGWRTADRTRSEPQGEPSDAPTREDIEYEALCDQVSEANRILARIVSAANKGPLEGEDGFILGYQMAPGPIHAAIPFLQKQGIVVTTSGEIRTPAVQGENRIEALIEASSLGTPEAQALRATVSDEKAAALVAEAHRRASTPTETQELELIEPPNSGTVGRHSDRNGR
ncbi:hypothetical protein [Microbacterium maritypicum]